VLCTHGTQFLEHALRTAYVSLLPASLANIRSTFEPPLGLPSEPSMCNVDLIRNADTGRWDGVLVQGFPTTIIEASIVGLSDAAISLHVAKCAADANADEDLLSPSSLVPAHAYHSPANAHTHSGVGQTIYTHTLPTTGESLPSRSHFPRARPLLSLFAHACFHISRAPSSPPLRHHRGRRTCCASSPRLFQGGSSPRRLSSSARFIHLRPQLPPPICPFFFPPNLTWWILRRDINDSCAVLCLPMCAFCPHCVFLCYAALAPLSSTPAAKTPATCFPTRKASTPVHIRCLPYFLALCLQCFPPPPYVFLTFHAHPHRQTLCPYLSPVCCFSRTSPCSSCTH
jgi:hypothetical protein